MAINEIKIDVMKAREIITMLEEINFHSSLNIRMKENVSISEDKELKWMNDVQSAMRLLIQNNPNNVFRRKETI